MKHLFTLRVMIVMTYLLVVCVPTGALAEHPDQSIDLSSSMGLYALDKEGYDNGLAWGLGIGLSLSEKIGTEFSFHAVDSEYKGYDAQILLYKLDLVYHLTGRLPESIVPYVAAGIGMATFNNDQPEFKKDSDLLLNAALGLKYSHQQHCDQDRCAVRPGFPWRRHDAQLPLHCRHQPAARLDSSRQKH